MKTCTKCGATKPLTEYNKCAHGRDGHRTECKPCRQAYCRAYKAARRSKTRVCTSCRRALDITEVEAKCNGCKVAMDLHKLTRSLPSRLGRPGCVVYGSVCKVLDAANERWLEMPVKHCKRCGLDQHLDECLDCTAPVGQGDKQKSIRALGHCVECGDWAANRHCPRCVK